MYILYKNSIKIILHITHTYVCVMICHSTQGHRKSDKISSTSTSYYTYVCVMICYSTQGHRKSDEISSTSTIYYIKRCFKNNNTFGLFQGKSQTLKRAIVHNEDFYLHTLLYFYLSTILKDFYL